MTNNIVEGAPIKIGDISDLIREFYNEFHAKYQPEKKKKQKPLQMRRKATSPTTIDLTDKELLERILRAGNAKKFRALFSGNWEQFNYPSASEADYGFCCLLAFYTTKFDQILRFVRRSSMWREKWEHESYQQATIQKAIDNRSVS